MDNGVKKLIVSSPHCFHTFKNEYPEFMVNFEVVHMSQYILELINDGGLNSTGSFRNGLPIMTPVIWDGITGYMKNPERC